MELQFNLHWSAARLLALEGQRIRRIGWLDRYFVYLSGKWWVLRTDGRMWIVRSGKDYTALDMDADDWTNSWPDQASCGGLPEPEPQPEPGGPVRRIYSVRFAVGLVMRRSRTDPTQYDKFTDAEILAAVPLFYSTARHATLTFANPFVTNARLRVRSLDGFTQVTPVYFDDFARSYENEQIDFSEALSPGKRFRVAQGVPTSRMLSPFSVGKPEKFFRHFNLTRVYIEARFQMEFTAL